MTKNALILSENATNATRDPETGVATTPGELAVTKPWKQRWLLFFLGADMIFVTNITNIISGEKLPCGESSAFHVWQLWGNQKFLHNWKKFKFFHVTYVEKS